MMVAKYVDHCPLYRQSDPGAARDHDRSGDLGFLGRYAAVGIKPVWRLLRNELLSSTKLFVDETSAPVLDPGRERTKKNYFWVLARGAERRLR
jgi:hypothetical protein